MASTFSGLTIAYTGLQTYQAATNTTAHNISNVKTDGYSRQKLDITAADALRVYSSYGCVGQGVQANSIERVRNEYYDEKYRNNASRLGEYEMKDNYMTQIEDYLNEYKLQGFTTEYDNFFKALEELQKNPSDDTLKNQVISYGTSIAEYFNTLSKNLQGIQENANQEIQNKVTEINTIAQNIASLNKQINIIEVHGTKANDLRDERDKLLDDLSSIVNIEVSEKEIGNGATTFDVKINGQYIVDTYNYNTLELTAKEDRQHASDADGMYDITWSNGFTFNEYLTSLGGELRALIDIRDGCNDGIETSAGNVEYYGQVTANYKGIPHYQAQLNRFVNTFVDAINSVFKKGESTNGDAGMDFFTVKYEGSDLSATNIQVNEEYVNHPSKFPTTYDASQGISNADLVDEMIALKDDKMFDGGTASYFLQSLVSEVSIDAEKARTFNTNFKNISNTVKNQRLSVMGTDEDEEAMDLMKFQSAYNLCGQVMSVLNQMYNKLINEMGI